MLDRRSILTVGAAALAVLPIAARAQDTAKLRDELMALEKGSWDFLRDNNSAGMRGFLADDALLIFNDGKRYNKREFLALMPELKLTSIAIEPTFAVRMIGPGIATLLYRATYTSTFKGGAPETAKVISSSVYARRDNKWWSVLYQETPIK
ncbi:MAG: nuclear transport factor 2 family protein [Proteobacteria bacterium]|nr:nuclear transport factor 2 family protein [Pseudomonadota bacterium]